MNSLADFDRIYVINLAHRGDRRIEIAQQLALVGLSFESPNVVLFEAVRPKEPGGFDSIGARGCFMSHLGILQQAKNLRNVLIFEDDLDFIPDIAARIGPVLEALPMDWGLFYGGCVIDLAPGPELLARVPPTADLRTSHFVAFNGPVVGKLVEHLEAILERPPGDMDGGPMHVDGAYSRFRAENPGMAVFVALPELGYQRPSRTDIHSLKWFDRVPGVREFVQALRRQRALHRRRAGPKGNRKNLPTDGRP